MADDVRDRQIDSIIQRMAQCVDRISDLSSRMTIVLEQQAHHTLRVDKLETKLEAQVSSLSGRISELEKWLWRLTGVGGAALVAFEVLKVLK